MGVSVGHLCYLGWWYVRALAGRRKPLQSVIFLLDRCNLKCRHCSVYAIAEPRVQTYEQIRSQLQYCYDEGSRYVDFEGGELYLWQDGDKRIDDVIDLAHEIGFWSVTITTNAQLPFANSHADQVWVSLDGVGEMHDAIRGAGAFRRLEEHIAAAGRQVSVNMVINRINVDDVPHVMDYVMSNSHIADVSFNFHTPFSETEELFLDPDRRNQTIDLLLDYKKRGYPIMNTVSGLKAMRMVDGKTRCTDRYCWVTNFVFSDGSRSPKCMGYTHGVCDRCGFSMGGEMYSLFHLSPDTIRAGLKLREQ